MFERESRMPQKITQSVDSESVSTNCFHPSNCFIGFPEKEIEQSIPHRFEKIVAQFPNRIAVGTSAETLTYAQLNARANRLAHAIVAKRGPTQEPVGMLLNKGLPLIVALLGVLKAGKTYVLVDPAYPDERIKYILNHAQSPLVITDENQVALHGELIRQLGELINLNNFDDNGATHDLKMTIPPESLAWIHYTSGSTGEPKGVMQTHRYVLHKVLRDTDDIHICPYDRFTFPASRGGDMYSALLNGASVYPIDIKETGMTSLINSLRQDEITIYSSVTSTFRYMLHSLHDSQNFSQLRVIKVIGEPLYKSDVQLYKKHFPENCVLINRLGSNETGTFCQNLLDHRTPLDDNVIPVGHPVKDSEVVLLDDAGQEVAAGAIGEFAVRGRHLSVGYWRNPELTRAAFTADPADENKRLYRVGDLGRRRSDGSFVHLGRKDFQLKINGNRVEIAEVEAALLSCENVKETAVVSRDDSLGGKRLAAYVVAKRQPPPTTGELRNKLASILPEFMIPSTFVFMEALPVIGMGKVDRRALPPLDAVSRIERPRYRAPRTEIQTTLCSVWAKIFNLPQVGIDDNFFALGGHSLLAAQMFALLDEKFGRSFPLSLLLSSPTIKQLAEHFSALPHKQISLVSLVPLRAGGSKPAIFAVPGIFGNVLGFVDLSRVLGDEQPFYALQSIGLDGQHAPIESIEKMAELYIREIGSVQASGPYVILGACFGATVAFEVARQLLAAGQEVAYLGLLDPSIRESQSSKEACNQPSIAVNRTRAIRELLSGRLRLYREELRNIRGYTRISYLLRKMFAVGVVLADHSNNKQLTREFYQLEVTQANRRALRQYQRRALSGRLRTFEIFQSTHPRNRQPNKFSWETLWSGKVHHHFVAAEDSGDMLTQDNSLQLAGILAERLKVVFGNATIGLEC